jgi:SPP1 family predicted phage head-tail adaptor
MNSSELKWKITLQAPVQVDSGYGTKQSIDYTDSFTTWANKIDIGGNKSIQNFEMFTSSIVQFEIRFRTDFDETYRIVHNGRYYEIANIKEKEYHRTLVITADLLQ